jgi:hypothetical protein
MKVVKQITIILTVLIVFQCGQVNAESWLLDLLNPHISHWSPIQSGSDSLQVEYIGLNSLDGIIAAFGDFNADK